MSTTFPTLVLAQANLNHATSTAKSLRQWGWNVHIGESGIDARHLAHQLAPEVVLLDTELQGESGWLTCAKLTLNDRSRNVVLLSKQVTAEDRAFARMVQARAIVACNVEHRDWMTQLSSTIPFPTMANN